jgi:hypothetical protein
MVSMLLHHYFALLAFPSTVAAHGDSLEAVNPLNEGHVGNLRSSALAGETFLGYFSHKYAPVEDSIS